MWILWFFLRLVAAALGAVLRKLTKNPGPSGERQTFQGQTIYVDTKTYKGSVTRMTFGVLYRGPDMRLVREGHSDRLFKLLGLSTEFETGDRAFDEQVYIICDHPSVDAHLKWESQSRDAVLDVLNSQFDEIRSDGECLWISTPIHKSADEGYFQKLLDLRDALSSLESTGLQAYRDPFVIRALATEAVIWSIAGYALISAFEFMWSSQTVFPDSSALIADGLKTSGLLFVGLLTVVWFLFKGSSRGHRVILESLLVLLFSLPIAGIQLVADLNRSLDLKPPLAIHAQLSDKKTTTHTDSKGRKSYTYHLHLDYSDDHHGLPTSVQVSPSLYHKVTKNDEVKVEIGLGALGHLWIRSLERL